MAAVAGSSKPHGGDHATDIQGVMNVTKEDQQRINKFARLNARHEDIVDEIATKTNELRNYDDAQEEATLQLMSDDAGAKLHIQVGDILVQLDQDQVEKWLEEKSNELKQSLGELEKRKEEISKEMTELKALLYARFGDNIHLESGV